MSTSTNMDAMDCEDSTLPPSSPEKSGSTDSITVNRKVARAVNESAKLLNTNVVIPKDAFVTINADTGEYRSRFRILPYSRCFNPKFFGRFDNLSHCIKKGGGIVLEYGEDDPLSLKKSRDDVIKILDLEYVRANIGTTQDMLLPYDCFSSSFVWNQVHHRSTSSNGEKRDADLNLYRVSPSSLVSYDANAIFQGFMCWNEIQPISSDKLAPAVRIKEVAMQMFPEIIFFPECEAETTKRTRRFYQKKEGQALLDKICEMNAHDQVFGVKLYRELAKNCFENRSALSLKEHFKKTVLPHVLKNDDYYFVEPDHLAKFQMITHKEGRGMLKEMKKERMKEANNDIC